MSSHGDMHDLVERGYDAVADRYAIEHVPRERHAEVLARFHDWLRRPVSYLWDLACRA